MRKYYSQKDINSEKVYVRGNMSVKGIVDDEYSLGYKLEGDALSDIVRNQVNKGALPQDSKGVYLILTSDDVKEVYRYGDGEMCVDYCGYHLTGEFTDGSIFYFAMVGVLAKSLTI